MLAGMLSPLNDRGPDSAGFAVYGAETPGHVKFTLRLSSTADLDRLLVESLKSIPGVFRTRTTIVLATAKESVAVPLAEEA